MGERRAGGVCGPGWGGRSDAVRTAEGREIEVDILWCGGFSCCFGRGEEEAMDG